MDVFNHSFWKLYIKTVNELDPGLNLPEVTIMSFVSDTGTGPGKEGGILNKVLYGKPHSKVQSLTLL